MIVVMFYHRASLNDHISLKRIFQNTTWSVKDSWRRTLAGKAPTKNEGSHGSVQETTVLLQYFNPPQSNVGHQPSLNFSYSFYNGLSRDKKNTASTNAGKRTAASARSALLMKDKIDGWKQAFTFPTRSSFPKVYKYFHFVLKLIHGHVQEEEA